MGRVGFETTKDPVQSTGSFVLEFNYLLMYHYDMKRRILVIGEVFILLLVIALVCYSLFGRDRTLDKYNGVNGFEDMREIMKTRLAFTKTNPNSDGAYFFLGQDFFTLGGYDDALWALKKAIEINPKVDTYWSWLGKTYQAQKDYVPAKHAYIKALELEPNRQMNYTILAWLYYFRTDDERGKAYEVLKKGLEKFPDEKTILFDITRYYMYDENKTEFLKYAPKYFKLDPDYPQIKAAFEKWHR